MKKIEEIYESTVVGKDAIDFILFSPFGETRKIGAYRIAMILREQGYTVKVIDFLEIVIQDAWSTKFIKKFYKHFVHKNTIFGFSATFMYHFLGVASPWPGRGEDGSVKKKVGKNFRNFSDLNDNTLSLNESLFNFVDQLKDFFPDNKIVIGGKGEMVQHMYEMVNADHLFYGYSEETAANQLIDIFKNKPTEKEIDSGDALDWDFHNCGTTFHPSDFIFPNESLPLEISRGCRFKCKFCGFSLLGRKVSDKYIRNSKHIWNELISNYENFGTTNYNILCDTFNETTEKLLVIKDLFDRFKRITGKQIRFNCYLRLELIHRYPEQIQIMKDMGIMACQFGIETLNYESAKAIGKGIKTEDVYSTIQAIRDSWGPDVSLWSGFIIGLPHDNRETVNQWLGDLYDKKLALTGWKLQALRIYKGAASAYTSEFSRNSEKYGYTFTEMPMKNEKLSYEWKNEHWTFTECNDIVVAWGNKFLDDGIVKFKDKPWDYLNLKNNFVPDEKEHSQYFDSLLDEQGAK